MLYFSFAVVISIALIVFGKPSIDINYHYKDNQEIVSESGDMYNSEGDIKAEYDGKQVSMDEYIHEINSLMRDDDKEIE